VNDAVLHRYAESTRVAEELADRALIHLLAEAGQATVVANPTSRSRAGMVAAVIPGDVAPPHTQQVSVRPARDRTEGLDRRAAVPVVLRAAVEDPRVSRVEFETDGDVPVAVLHADRRPKAVDVDALRAHLEELAAAEPEGRLHLDVVRPGATQEVLVRTPAVPGFGWCGLAPDDLGSHAVRPEGAGLTNGLVTVLPHQTDGTFSIDGLGGLGRLVDGGDAGDTYNWSPPGQDRLVDRPDAVDVLVTEAGPVRGRVVITRHYSWPTHAEGGGRTGEAPVVVTTTVEVRAGEDLVRVHVELDNPSRDHRLRIHLPLPERADRSVAECAFGTVTRGLEAEGGPNEHGLPTFPSRRFVQAGGLTVVHDGLCEYELVDLEGGGSDGQTGAAEIALTLLRSVGTISRGPMATRALPAGPPTPTPAAQMPGPHHADLVLHLGGRDPYAVADEAFTPLLVARRPGGGFGDPSVHGVALEVAGAEVTALTRRRDGRRELRVVNTDDEPSTLTVTGARGEVTDLRGQPTGTAFDGRLELGPRQIVTIALDEN
jgi:hypothetical protein